MTPTESSVELLSSSSVLQVFDRSPIGIVQVDGAGRITYMNRLASTISGLTSWAGQTIRQLFPDECNYCIVKDQLTARLQGRCDEYRAELTRATDGQRIPVAITGMPLFDEFNAPAGAISIVRSLLVEDAAHRLNERMNSAVECAEILNELAIQLRRVVAFDALSVSTYNREVTEARILFDDPSEFIPGQQTWFPVSPSLRHWLMEDRRTVRALQDLPGIAESNSGAALLNQGYRWLMRCPVWSEGRLLAGVSLLRRSAEQFDDAECAAFGQLPVAKAVLAALYLRGRAELQFKYSLLKDFFDCETDKELFALLVTRLCDQYGWSHVSVFTVDWIAQQFLLQSERTSEPDRKLPLGYSQSIDSGVLGRVYQLRTDLNLQDIGNDPEYKNIVVKHPMLGTPGSELCLQIFAGAETYALLNVEDRHRFAFSREEQDSLRALLDELGTIMARRRNELEVVASFNATTTAVFITDGHAIIRRVNNSAEALLGYSANELIGTAVTKYAKDQGAVEVFRNCDTPTGELELVRKDGSTVRVLVGGSTISGARDRKQITFRDATVHYRARELEEITGAYAELCRHMKTPLSIVGMHVRDLEHLRSTGGRAYASDAGAQKLLIAKVRHVAREMNRQLQRLELSYDTVLMYALKGGAPSFNHVSINCGRLFTDLLTELPEGEAARIKRQVIEENSVIVGDPWQLGWVLQTLMVQALRLAPSSVSILGSLMREDKCLRLRLSWGSVESEVPQGQSLSCLTQLRDSAYGPLLDSTIRSLAHSNGAVFHPITCKNGTTTIGIDFHRLSENAA